MADWIPPGAVEVPQDTVASPAVADTSKRAGGPARQRPIRAYKKNDWISNGIGLAVPAGNIAGDLAGAGLAAAAIPETMGGSALAIPAMTAAGGGVGQAGGRALQLALLQGLGYAPPADMNPQGPAADLAGQAGWGAASSLGGRVLPWLFRSGATGLMGSALNTTERPAIEAALSEGIRPGKSVMSGQTGSQQLKGAIDQYSAQVNAHLADAATQGVKFRVGDVIGRARQSIAEAAKIDPSKATEMQKVLDDFMSTYLPKRGARGRVLKMPEISPAELQNIKIETSKIATPLYKSINAGAYPGLRSEARAIIYKDIADASREQLATRIPPVGPLNEAMEPLLAELQPVMRQAERKFGGGVVGVSGKGMTVQPFNLLPQGVAGQTALTLNAPLTQGATHFGSQAILSALMPHLFARADSTQGGGTPQ